MMLSMARRSLFQPRNAVNVFLCRCFSSSPPRTLLDKIWHTHLVDKQDDGTCLVYIDRHLVHEVTSPQAFEGLRTAGRQLRQPAYHLAVADHNVPTTNRDKGIEDDESRLQIETLTSNVAEFNVPYIPMDDVRQGIVHIIGPELGFTLPGMTIVCGDSHTATHGAFGSLAFGIGTSEVEHVMATQTLTQKPDKSMRINVHGTLPSGLTSKDLILHIIGQIGTAGGTGHIIEYAGEAIKALSMESRMTICNMSIEAGARAGMIAPDQTTFDYLKGKPLAPKGDLWTKAVEFWQTLPSDTDAHYDTEIHVDVSHIVPQVTWGTSPEDVAPVDGYVPNPSKESDVQRQAALERALNYMGLQAGQKISEIEIDTVFIGSCTNGRIEDIRAVAEVSKGRKTAKGVRALVVPGSGLVKKQAESEGLSDILIEAGFEWREPGCSMCLAMNADRLEAGQRCASTSNRNFEGRQGRGGRTHLVSPAMAAAAAITGKLTDVRQLSRPYSTLRHKTTCRCCGSSPIARKFSTISPFTRREGVIAPMEMANIDTDKIIPKQFLKTIKRTGLGEHLFFEDRYDDDGNPNPSFVLNQKKYEGASMLVAGDNFGCGSSREHAPWALLDYGITCVVSTSFADIFYNNCFKNGILPIVLTKDQVDALFVDSRSDTPQIVVDLERQEIVRDGGNFPFVVDEFRRYCLLNGLDQIGLTLQKEQKIADFEENYRKLHPWV